MRQYILNAKCGNCGFGDLFGSPVAIEYQKPLANQECPVCGLAGYLHFHNGHMAETKILLEGIRADNRVVIRTPTGQFAPKSYISEKVED